MTPYATPIEQLDGVLSGPFRKPRNMLSEQTYGGHASLHDDATAQQLGFKAAAIEGPTHFSQLEPLACAVWGERWFREGCLSISFKAACSEGDEVRAFLRIPPAGETQTDVWMVRADGTEVLRGTAGVGTDHPPTALEAKRAGLPVLNPLRVILRGVEPGMQRERMPVRLDADRALGDLYPFTLNQKLAQITEPSDWQQAGAQTPFGAAVIPLEMVSVLVHHVASDDPWVHPETTVDLFVDQEIHMIAGPLLVGQAYEIERRVVALSESRRTESCWVETRIFLPGGAEPVAAMVLNVASLKDSCEGYADKQAAIAAAAS